MTQPLHERRLIFITGKGGVGKTLVSAALAIRLGQMGKRVLLLEIGEVGSLAPVLGLKEVTYAPVQVNSRVSVARLTPRECMEEYGLQKLRLKSLYRLVFENVFVRALLNMLPGMEELLLVGKIGFIIETQVECKHPDYDVIVVDSPPTGQGAGLVSLPATILSAVKAGPVAREVRKLHQLLIDPTRTGIVTVTLPEELAVDEALELEEELTGQRELPLAAVLVNRCIPPIFNRRQGEVIETWLHAKRATRARTWAYPIADTAHSILHLSKEQDNQIQRLRSQTTLPIVLLPFFAGGEWEGHVEEVAVGLAPLLDVRA